MSEQALAIIGRMTGPVWVAVDWIRFRTDTNLLLIGQ